MNAIFLHRPDGTATKWSMCSECGRVDAPGNFDLSQKCCTCYDCGQPLPKDERTPYYSKGGNVLYHRACELALRSKRDAEVLEKAELVVGYDGPVYIEGGVGRGSYGDGFFSDVHELSEHLDFHEGDQPLFAFCCTSRAIHLDLETILQDATEEMYEDCADALSGVDELLSGVDELVAAVDAFNAANASVLTWDPDHKRKVAIPRCS
jgi:hypothetical protein